MAGDPIDDASTGRPGGSEASVRVVLADDHLLIREGVAALLASIDGVEVVGECDDHDSLLAAVDELRPDVVVTDIRMPPSHNDEGIRAAKTIKAASDDVGVVVLSQFAEPEFVLELFDAGSDRLGYLLKDRVTRSALSRAIHTVRAGGSAVDPQIVELLVGARGPRSSQLDALTPREREVLACIAEGASNSAVAERLVVTEKAVAKHINSIFSKLDLGNGEDTHRRVRAVLIWLSQ